MTANTETRNSSMLNNARAVAFSINASLDQTAGNIARLRFVPESEVAGMLARASEQVEAARAEMAKVVRVVLDLSAADFARLQDQADL